MTTEPVGDDADPVIGEPLADHADCERDQHLAMVGLCGAKLSVHDGQQVTCARDAGHGPVPYDVYALVQWYRARCADMSAATSEMRVEWGVRTRGGGVLNFEDNERLARRASRVSGAELLVSDLRVQKQRSAWRPAPAEKENADG